MKTKTTKNKSKKIKIRENKNKNKKEKHTQDVFFFWTLVIIPQKGFKATGDQTLWHQ